METFSALLAICAGNSPVPSEFPAQWPVTRSFREAGDLRRYRAHYDVTVMNIGSICCQATRHNQIPWITMNCLKVYQSKAPFNMNLF